MDERDRQERIPLSRFHPRKRGSKQPQLYARNGFAKSEESSDLLEGEEISVVPRTAEQHDHGASSHGIITFSSMVNCMSWISSGRENIFCAVGLNDGRIVVVDTLHNCILFEVHDHCEAGVYCMASAEAGAGQHGILISAAKDGCLHFWNNTNALPEKINLWNEKYHPSHLDANVYLDSFALSANGEMCASGYSDGTIVFLENASSITTSVNTTFTVNSLVFSSDGVLCISGAGYPLSESENNNDEPFQDYPLFVWYVPETNLYQTMYGHTNCISCICIVSENGICISGSYDCTLRVWDVFSGECVSELVNHRMGVTCMAVSKQGSICVSGGMDSVLCVWDIINGSLLGVFPNTEHIIYPIDLLISDERRVLISVSQNACLEYWDLNEYMHAWSAVEEIAEFQFKDFHHFLLDDKDDDIARYEQIIRDELESQSLIAALHLQDCAEGEEDSQALVLHEMFPSIEVGECQLVLEQSGFDVNIAANTLHDRDSHFPRLGNDSASNRRKKSEHFTWRRQHLIHDFRKKYPNIPTSAIDKAVDESNGLLSEVETQLMRMFPSELIAAQMHSKSTYEHSRTFTEPAAKTMPPNEDDFASAYRDIFHNNRSYLPHDVIRACRRYGTRMAARDTAGYDQGNHMIMTSKRRDSLEYMKLLQEEQKREALMNANLRFAEAVESKKRQQELKLKKFIADSEAADIMFALKNPRLTDRISRIGTASNDEDQQQLCIDLHFLRSGEAYERAKACVQLAYENRWMNLRIITGRGIHSKNNVSVLTAVVQSLLQAPSITKIIRSSSSCDGYFLVKLKTRSM